VHRVLDARPRQPQRRPLLRISEERSAKPSPEWIRPVPVGHHLPERCRVVATPILRGLHHEYRVAREAARPATMQLRIILAALATGFGLAKVLDLTPSSA